MTQQELYECMNIYITMWKSMIQGTDHRDSTMRIWVDRGFLKLDKDLFTKALYEYEDTSDKNYLAPRPKQILEAYKTVKARSENKTNRRIETPEEVIYSLYLQEMKKEPSKRDENKIRTYLPYARLFNDPMAYKRHFGKTREEFERL